MERQNVIVEKSFQFALRIINYSETLQGHKKFIVSQQLLKAGTSIGANVREGQGAESRADFVHKFKIALKEAEETEYWLLLCKSSETYPFEEALLVDVRELILILNSIITSAKRNAKR